MTLKLYNETEIFINSGESKIVLTRGYWNFIQTTLDFRDMKKKNREELIEIFNKLKEDRQIDDQFIKNDFKEEFEQLITERLLYSTTKKPSETKSLFITDIPDYLKGKFDEYNDNIIFYSTSDFHNDLLNGMDRNDLYHDPLLKNEIQKNLDRYIKENNIDIVFVVLLRANNSFCNILNHLLQKKIVFAFFDNDLIYLFGTELKYTGCYSCFSKGMEARRTHEYTDYPTSSSNVIFPENYLLDFLSAIIEYNLSGYIQNDIIPIYGRICAISALTLEIRYENLLRSSFCEECGFISLMENKERNFNLKNFLNDGKKMSYHLAGYGVTRPDTLIRLIGETIERYSLAYCYQYLKNKVFGNTYDDLKKDGLNVMDLKFLNVFNETEDINHVSNDDVIGWFKLIDVLNQESVFIPAQMFFLTYALANKMNEKINFVSISTGTASHTSYENALKNSLTEYLQTDSFMLFWYGKNIQAPEVVLDDETKDFLEKNILLPENHDILVLDLTFDKPFPILVVIIHGEEYPRFSFGIQGSHSPYQALYRGLLESASVMNYLDGSVFYNTEDFIRSYDEKQVFDNLDSNSIFWANDSQISEKNNFLKSKIRGKKNIGYTDS